MKYKKFEDLEFSPILDSHRGERATMLFKNSYGVVVTFWKGSVGMQMGPLENMYELTIIHADTGKLATDVPPYDTIGHLTPEDVTLHMKNAQKLK